MLRKRLLSAAILISTALLFIALDVWAGNWGRPGLWLLPLGFCLIFGSAYECTVMVKASPIGSITAPALMGCLTVMLAACVPMLWPVAAQNPSLQAALGYWGWPMAGASMAIVGSFIWYFPQFEAGAMHFQRAVLSGWLACYFGVCFAFIIALRLLGSDNWGLFVLMGVILTTKVADTGAYFAGRSLGRNKLCPRVSPNKTVEGLLGGVLAACLAAWLYFELLAPRIFGQDQVGIDGQVWPGVLLLGGGLSLTGLAGDLMQSLIKRQMGVKDSGQLLPGMGGLWDVTDSLLPAGVVGYLITAAGVIVGPGL